MSKLPEANLQGEFYHCSKMIGLNIILEYKTPVGRLDIAVLNDDKSMLIAIVECKRNRINPNTNQMAKYRTIGVPVYGLCEMEKCQNLASELFNSRNGHGVPLSVVQSMKKIRRQQEDRATPRRFHPLNLCEEINFKP